MSDQPETPDDRDPYDEDADPTVQTIATAAERSYELTGHGWSDRQRAAVETLRAWLATAPRFSTGGPRWRGRRVTRASIADRIGANRSQPTRWLAGQHDPQGGHVLALERLFWREHVTLRLGPERTQDRRPREPRWEIIVQPTNPFLEELRRSRDRSNAPTVAAELLRLARIALDRERVEARA